MFFTPSVFQDVGATVSQYQHFTSIAVREYMDEPKIPENEKWVYENPEILNSLESAIAQAENGEVFDLGDFTQFVDPLED